MLRTNTGTITPLTTAESAIGNDFDVVLLQKIFLSNDEIVVETTRADHALLVPGIQDFVCSRAATQALSTKASAVHPVPERAPEFWADRAPDTRESIVDFISRVYGAYIKRGNAGSPMVGGMVLADLRRLDKTAYIRLQQWCSYHGIRASTILPAKRSDPEDVLARSDLHPTERRRALAAMRNRRYRAKRPW